MIIFRPTVQQRYEVKMMMQKKLWKTYFGVTGSLFSEQENW